ncbi:MAG: hypothetical protein PF569_08095 [Candidatus Woesearchaeota archaeon]|jgi:hypothetical protein|nr:hypothetical protein [Candidatus Woesearchaeota archaeon]
MVGTETTLELYNIAMKYQEKYKEYKKLNIEHFDIIEILYKEWKVEPLKESLGFSRTRQSVMFMLEMKEWFYIDKKTGKLLDDKNIRYKPFKIS